MTSPRAAALLFLVALLGGGGACDSTKGATAPVCCPPDKPLTDSCAHLGGTAISRADSAGGGSCPQICDWVWCATNVRLEHDEHGCEVWRIDTRAPGPGENWQCQAERDAGRVTDAGRDASIDGPVSSSFCASLVRGASFASTELLWCSVGWGRPDAAPSPTEAPDLYCHWTLAFRGAKVAWTQTDYTASGLYTCAGSTFTALGEQGTWDTARGTLTFSGNEYRPSLPDASTGRL